MRQYVDEDEFWVVGDFLARQFMEWGGEGHMCYVDGCDPLRAERFSTWREARRFMHDDEDAAQWVADHGGPRFAKPLKCRKCVVVYPPGRGKG